MFGRTCLVALVDVLVDAVVAAGVAMAVDEVVGTSP
jgi:hypothetical protein